MEAKMKDSNRPLPKKKKADERGRQNDDMSSKYDKDAGSDHANGDMTETDPDPYEWEDDGEHANTDPDDRRRQIRNKTEKQRKDKIRSWIGRISDVIPNCSDRLGSGKKPVKSMNFILEKCYDYMVYLKDQNSSLLSGKGDEAQAAEIVRLKKELNDVTQERDALASLIKENKSRVDASKMWADRLDSMKINPEKVDLTKLIKTMRKPNNLAHVILNQEPTDSDRDDVAPKKKRKLKEFEDENEADIGEIENRPPLIDCNVENRPANNEDAAMFSPNSDISNITPVDIPMPDVDESASSGPGPVSSKEAVVSESFMQAFGSHSALQTLASVATTDLDREKPAVEAERQPLPVSVHNSTSVTQSLTMPIMSTSTQHKSPQMTGTQLSGNIIMQNGQLIVLNEPFASDGKSSEKSPDKTRTDQNSGSNESNDMDQQSMANQQQNTMLANQQMNLGLPANQLPILNQPGMVPNTPGILPMNLGMQQQAQNLPQALILPDGRIIPVVTQPNLMFPSMNNVIMAQNQGQGLIGSGANLLMNQQPITTSQGQPLATPGVQNLDQLQPTQILSQSLLNPGVNLPMTNYVVTSDGQVIQSVPPGLNLPTVHNQFPNITQTKTTSSQSQKEFTNPQNQPLQQVQVITSSGNVLTLQVPAGTQPQQLLLDPNTLQPIVQPSKAPTQITQNQTSVSNTTTSSSVTTATGKKNNKKGQRVLMPKPANVVQPGASIGASNILQMQQGAIDKDTEPPPAKKAPRPKELTISQKLQALNASANTTDIDSTDILAKAAESIFSGDMSEFGAEEKQEKPDSNKKKRKKVSRKDKDPTSTLSGKDLAHLVVGGAASVNQTITATPATSATVLTVTDTKLPQSDAGKEPPKKKNKKKQKTKENPKIDPSSLPDTITFDENDLSDVLDQVEKISVPDVGSEKSPDKNAPKGSNNISEDKDKRKSDKNRGLDLDSHDEIADPGLEIVLDPPSNPNTASPKVDGAGESPSKSDKMQESRSSGYKPDKTRESHDTRCGDAGVRTNDNHDVKSRTFSPNEPESLRKSSIDKCAKPFTSDYNNDRPTKDATLKAIDVDEPKDSTILDSISRIMDENGDLPPATPSTDLVMEKDNLFPNNLSLLSSMAAADREHDRSDESATQKELFPDLPSKDDRQKDAFSPFNFSDSPIDIDKSRKEWKDLSPTSSASAPLLRHSVESLFSSGRAKDSNAAMHGNKESSSMPGSMLSQLNSPIMDLTMQEDKNDDATKTFPAQQLLPELDTKQKQKPETEPRTGFFTSEGLVQPNTEARKETLPTPSYFDQPANAKSVTKSVIQKADKPKETNSNYYSGLNPSSEKLQSKDISEFARNSPPPVITSTAGFNNTPQVSSSFSAPVTSSVAPFSFTLTSTVNSTSVPSTATTSVPSSGSFGSHHFPFYPLHPSLSSANSAQNNDSMNLIPFSDSGRGLQNAPPPLMNNMNQQPKYPNYNNAPHQGTQFIEPQPIKGPHNTVMANPRYPQPRRPNEMNQPRPYQDLSQSATFDPSRMGPRLPNQFDMNRRPPDASQSPTMPSFSSSMPVCEMGGAKPLNQDCPRPSPGEITRSRRQSDQGSHIGTSPRMSDINQSPRMPEINQSPRLADLNQSPRLSEINQSPRLSDINQSPRMSDQSPGRAENTKRLTEILPPQQQQQQQQQQRPRSGPGGGPMFYPQPFNPTNPMGSPPLHHPNRPEIEPMRPNFESNFNAPQDFNPVLNFGASGFDPPALELSSSSSTSTTQSAACSRPNQSNQPTQPAKPRERTPNPPPNPPTAPPAPKRPPAAQKPKSRPKTKKSAKPYEMDTNLSNSIFETGRSMTPYFPIASMPSPPPSRNDAPTYIGMPFGPSRPLSNTPGLMQPKPSSDMNSFGPLFPGNRPQNGLGLNFQPGFGMNHMAHGNPGQSLPPHANNVSVTPHMPNFSLTNIFGDMGQGQPDSLNISPIKFTHGNSILSQPDHMQHHHQPGIYHQRPHGPMIPNAMSINSLLGHNHGFDGRPMGPGMGPPFHGPGTPGLGMPFNFNMHDH